MAGPPSSSSFLYLPSVPPSLPPSASDVRSDDRHHRHISCVISAQSVSQSVLLLRLQKERGMGRTRTEEEERNHASVCLSSYPSICKSVSGGLARSQFAICNRVGQKRTGVSDGRSHGGRDGQTGGYPVHQTVPVLESRASWASSQQSVRNLGPSTSLQSTTHMDGPRLNGSVAFDRLSAPARSLGGPACWIAAYCQERTRTGGLIELSCLSSHFLGLLCFASTLRLQHVDYVWVPGRDSRFA